MASLCAGLIALPRVASAKPRAGDTVRGYFAALGRQDYDGALRLTDGEAKSMTAEMVGTLKEQAQRAHADIELHVQKVEVREGRAAGAQIPVRVRFHIDVVGKKWWFSRVAKRLVGTALFVVARAGESRIVGIDGKLVE